MKGSSVIVGLCGALLVACGGEQQSAQVPEEKLEAATLDLPVGDQCYVVVTQRPDDCVFRPPCMYADVVLYLSADDASSFSLTASSGGGVWMEGVPRRGDPKLPAIVFETPEAAAAHLPEVLSALDVSTIPVTQACVGVIADQDLRFGDVMAFRDALMTTGVRRVEFAYYVLAEN